MAVAAMPTTQRHIAARALIIVTPPRWLVAVTHNTATVSVVNTPHTYSTLRHEQSAARVRHAAACAFGGEENSMVKRTPYTVYPWWRRSAYHKTLH